MIKVYSHPRSGTHFLMKFLKENYYKEKDLGIPTYVYGHYNNRLTKKGGDEYSKLFGSHNLYPNKLNICNPSIYIYRDGREVALSIYKSKFYNKNWGDLAFKEFLYKKIDWIHSPGGIEKNPNRNILEHWCLHIKNWLNYKNDKLLFIKYKDLIEEPKKIIDLISNKFNLKKIEKAIYIGKTGLNPNNGKINSYIDYFDEDDNKYYYDLMVEFGIKEKI